MIDPISIITGLFLATVATGFMGPNKDEKEDSSSDDNSSEEDNSPRDSSSD